MTTTDNTRRKIIEAFVPQSPFAQKAGIRIEHIEDGRADLTMPFDEANATMGDVVHGGAIATLADTAAMAAAWSDDTVPDSLSGSTVGITVDFVAAARGTDLTARATVIRRGRSLCFLDVDVVDAEGGTVAKALATYRFGG